MSERPCASDFESIIRWEQHGDGEPEAIGIINWLCETGKAGHFVHRITEGFPQFMTLCALEDALVECKQEDGWAFVCGCIFGDDETKGWLEHGDWIVVPFGPTLQQGGYHGAMWTREAFDALNYQVWALTDCADDSAMVLNRMMRESFRIGPDESLGEAA